jgi:Cu(I)/Ag(I) efflux system protein CusF
MKLIATLSLIFVLSTSSLAIAQSGGMKDMDMQDMEMDKKVQVTLPKLMTHKATGVVKAVDSSKGTVTLAHGPVKSLEWPAMTMSFVVKDKGFFDRLIVGKKVMIEFIKQDTDYIVISVK